MLTLVLGFLTAIAPLITSAGLSLINLFVSNAADRAAAQKNFLSAIQSHLNDALQSVVTRNSVAQQTADLQDDMNAADQAADALAKKETVTPSTPPPPPKI